MMGRATERRLLQLATAFACLVPLLMGGTSILNGADVLKGMDPPFPVDLDSHYRYLSGLLFGIGLVFAGCIPGIERHATIFRALCLVIVCGGLARLLSLIESGVPSGGHQFGLVMELGVVPLVTLWQSRVARLYAR